MLTDFVLSNFSDFVKKRRKILADFAKFYLILSKRVGGFSKNVGQILSNFVWFSPKFRWIAQHFAKFFRILSKNVGEIWEILPGFARCCAILSKNGGRFVHFGKCWQILSKNVVRFRELLQILQEHVWRIVPQLARFWQIFLDFPPKFQPTRCHSFGGAELLQILARLHTGWGNGKQ